MKYGRAREQHAFLACEKEEKGRFSDDRTGLHAVIFRVARG